MMQQKQFIAFQQHIDDFSEKVQRWRNPALLRTLQEKYSDYPVENEVVYNTKLSAVTDKDSIQYIVVGDNPGKDEQLHSNRYYLMGKAGQQMRNFFRRHRLAGDFDREVLVLNKTPIHTRSTSDLRHLNDFNKLLTESQQYTARLTIALQRVFRCPVWIIGFSQMNNQGVFRAFTEELLRLADPKPISKTAPLLFFKHFSYGNFSRDLSATQSADTGMDIRTQLRQVGIANRKRVLGW